MKDPENERQPENTQASDKRAKNSRRDKGSVKTAAFDYLSRMSVFLIVLSITRLVRHFQSRIFFRAL